MAAPAVFDDGGALLSAGELPPLKKLGAGKVRDLYEVDAKRLLVVVTDRISAFDVIMKNGVPGKCASRPFRPHPASVARDCVLSSSLPPRLLRRGKVLTQLTAFWLRHLSANGVGCEHHLITDDVAQMPPSVQQHAAVLTGRTMLVHRLEMLPVEAIVRGYITGSGWADYTRTGSVCGHVLPTGLALCDKLPAALYTPSTKAELGAHDENISTSAAADLLGAGVAARVEALSGKVYALAAAHAEARGILVADTKMEFGVAPGGGGGGGVPALVLGDEVLTPDCSRYWPKEGYAAGRDQPSFDKQYVRDFLKEVGFDKATPVMLPPHVVAATLEKYAAIFKILTGAEPAL